MTRYKVNIEGSNIDIWDSQKREGMVISYVDKERRTRIYANNIQFFIKEMNKLFEENQKLKNNSELFEYLIKQLDNYINRYEEYYIKYKQIEYLEIVSILENIRNKMKGVEFE